MAKSDSEIIKEFEKELSKTMPPKWLDYAVNSAFRFYAELRCKSEQLAKAKE